MVSGSLTSSERYIIESVNGREHILGQGGMGTVFRGLDTQTTQPVAIKRLRSDVTRRDPELLKRFMREGEALRQLNHPNIVQMLDAFTVGDAHYLVMEFVSGGSLRALLEKTPRLKVDKTLNIALDIADALTRAHRLNILHRDIKPDNVLIAADGTPRLTDFGMARIGNQANITQDGMIVGTLAYMAPELFNGAPASEKTDLWSFGVMLYEMLAGERPFAYDQPGLLINAIIAQPVTNLETLRPDLPVALVDLVYRMLAKDPHARIASARVVGAELEAILRGDTGAMLPARMAATRFDTDTPAPAGVPSTSQRAIPHNLPAQPTAFIGREHELEALQKQLSQPETRLLTLLGPGGIGKTRLALALGERMLADFKDGVFFVPLAGVENAAHIPGEVASAIGFTGNRDSQSDMFAFIRSKHLLLIIDNFDHLASAANLISDLLQASAHVRVVMTSRERLRLRGEVVFEVDNLPVPPPGTDAATLETYASARLFLQSARRVVPDYQPDERDAATIGEILRVIQGLPLAIELAAAWLETLPLDEIASEITRSLDFLETDLRDVPQRHRSIRAVFEYSWALMTPEEQAVFSRLAVFRGGFERDAAEKVAGATLRLLTNLANKSLLQRDASGRYYVHKLLRQYAEQRADETVREQACEDHAVYYGLYMDKLISALNSDRELAAMDAIESEMENIRQAWDRAVKHGYFEAVEGVLDTLASYFLARSMALEGVAMLNDLLRALEQRRAAQQPLYYRALTRRAALLSRVGQVEQAWQDASAASDYFTRHEDIVEQAMALNQMAYCAMMQTDYPLCVELASKSIDLMQDMRDVPTWFMAMGHYGYAQFLMGELTQARYIYETLLHTAEKYPISPSSLGYYKNNLGEIFRGLGDSEKALSLFEDASAIFRREKNKRGMAFTGNNLASMRFIRGDLEGARKMYLDVHRLYRDNGDLYGLAHTESALGNVAQAQGDHQQALEHYERSLRIRREIGDRRGIGDSLADIALIQLNNGQYDAALHSIDESIAIRRETRDTVALAGTLAQKALGMAQGGRLDEAEAAALEAIQIEGEDVVRTYIQSRLALGMVRQLQGRPDQALELFHQVLDRTLSSAFVGLAMLALLGVAEIYSAKGRYEESFRIASMVQRFPNRYIRAIDERAAVLVERLRQQLPDQSITRTVRYVQEADFMAFVREVTESIYAS
jgi:serine/threonine protein kinase/predicted ATPase